MSRSVQTLDLPLLMPRGADCDACVRELSAALERLDGVREVRASVTRGLVQVELDGTAVTPGELSRGARRLGTLTHCPDHCPTGDHATHALPSFELDEPPKLESRLLHVTGLDCADCAVKLERALGSLPGVAAAHVDVGTATAKIDYQPSLLDAGRLTHEVGRLGYGTLESAREGTACSFSVEGMDCADCAAKLERRVRSLSGVREARVDFALARLTLTATALDDVAPRVVRAAAEMGYRLTAEDAPERQSRRTLPRSTLTLTAGALIVAGFVAQALAPATSPWLFATAMIAGGARVARAAYYSLRARSVDMNVLMTLAAAGAAAIGQWSEGALVMFLFSLGALLQAATLERTRRAIGGLMSNAPDTARVIIDGQERSTPASALTPGDLVRVLPGERLPVDGVIVEGGAAVDEAAVTGESMPVAKSPGDRVFAGSLAEGGALTVRASSTGDQTTVARIVHLVEEAQAQRAAVQTIVDRFAARYTPLVVGLAALVGGVPVLLGGSVSTWVYRALALLIISCPCALVISTPVSVLAALTRASRRGILIKGGVHLEAAARIRVVALDKTGTVTAGRPQVAAVETLDGRGPEEVLALAAAVESGSSHPLATAIVAAADAHTSRLQASRFHSVTGTGARADIDGQTVLVGKPDLFGAAAHQAAVVELQSRLERAGRTCVLVGTEELVFGGIAVADPVRPAADAAVDSLRTTGVERVVLLTGDNQATAEAIGAAVGVDEVHAGLLPQDKVTVVRRLSEQYGPVMMVGDGINDAPALAAAAIGVAMGVGGSDLALEAADIGLMGDDLSALADLIRLSRRAGRVIRWNIAFSLLVKGVFLVLAPLGLASLWMAVFADAGTSLGVTANGLRLQR